MTRRIASVTAAAAIAALVLVPGAGATSNTYVVDNLGDGHDALLEDEICATAGGVCTLRAAIEESNSAANFPALEGTETIPSRCRRTRRSSSSTASSRSRRT